MSKTSTKRAATEATENPDVAIVREATAPSRPRAARRHRLRGRARRRRRVRPIEKNHGGGSCSKEWVPFPVMGCGFDSRLAHHFISPGRMKVWRSYRGMLDCLLPGELRKLCLPTALKYRSIEMEYFMGPLYST